MTAFSFATATDIRFGRDEGPRALDLLAAMGTRLLLVHGANAARSAWLRDGLADRGCTVTGFAVAGEPDLPMIDAGLALARATDVQAVVAIGGGAVIDAGKALAALAPATRPVLDHLEVVGQGLPLDHAPLPFAALPTTSGTGAEVTRNAVISVPDARRKVSLRDARMLPRLAVVDPALTDLCPRAVTLASGLDAITQVIEPYISTRANPLTDALTLPRILPALRALARLMQTEDTAARDEMALTSLCGGLALANAGLGVVHGLAGPLGGLSNAPHGALCGVMLPHGLAANAARAKGDAAERIACVQAKIGQALDVPAAQAFDALVEWSAQAGLPGLVALGVEPDHRAEAARMAASSSSMKANPVALDETALADILDAAR